MKPIAVMLLAMAVPASAQEAGACRLTTAECDVIAHEIAAEQINIMRDEQEFGFGLSPYAKAQAIVARHFQRKAVRYKHLPVQIGNEWARMELCGHTDTESDPRCR